LSPADKVGRAERDAIDSLRGHLRSGEDAVMYVCFAVLFRSCPEGRLRDWNGSGSRVVLFAEPAMPEESQQ
jgi:hypothetical protein